MRRKYLVILFSSHQVASVNIIEDVIITSTVTILLAILTL